MSVRTDELPGKILSEDAVRVNDIIYNGGKAETEDYDQNRREKPSFIAIHNLP
jgi:hypothetical protein